MVSKKNGKAKGRRWLFLALGLPLALWISVLAAPQLLAFPYHAEIGITRVYSEKPFRTDDMRRILARSDALTTRTGRLDPAGTRIFLTDGGWRWRILALTSRGAFAYTRPISTIVSDAVVVNRADPTIDMAFNGRAIGGRRKLSGVIAHERTHIWTGRALGLVGHALLPNWKREGYADYIAQETSLTAAEYARLKQSGTDHPAIAYYESRQRIEAIAKIDGGTIAAMFSARAAN
jgi:hypothetical protein